VNDPQGLSWRLAGFAMAAGGAALLASKGVLAKLIYPYGLDGSTLIGLRMLLSVPAFAVVGVVEWRRRRPEHRPDGKLLVLACAAGVLGFYVSTWLDFKGLETLDAQSERLILFTYPFFVILFGRLILAHPLRPHALGGAALAYAGLALMFAARPEQLSDGRMTGAALVAGAAVTFALYQLFARELIVKCGAALFTAVAMVAAGVVAIGVGASEMHARALDIPAECWALIVALALFATILPVFMISAGMGRIGAQGTAIMGTLSPLVTAALAVGLLDEPFGPPELAGTLCVLGGVGLFSWQESRGSRRKPRDRPPQPEPAEGSAAGSHGADAGRSNQPGTRLKLVTFPWR
jgi:drug/metabolite transporter (DMT)-like permease